MSEARAIWKKVWERGVSISIRFIGLDGGNDPCEKCGKARKLHRREDDHRFVESKEDS